MPASFTPASLPMLLFALALMSGGCSSSGLHGDVYSKSRTRYRIRLPETPWQRLQVSHNDLAWQQPELQAIIQVNSSCSPDLDLPLRVLTNHLLIGFTERDVRSQRPEPLDGREALITHVIARLDGVPRELLLTVLKKDVCVFDFTLVAPPGPAFTHARGTYDALVSGFRAELTR